MKIKEAKALEKEYNEITEQGRDLWDKIEPLGKRCQEILNVLKQEEVPFDEIALLFGSELQIDVYGTDEEEA